MLNSYNSGITDTEQIKLVKTVSMVKIMIMDKQGYLGELEDTIEYFNK
jgi:hypothetical protein